MVLKTAVQVSSTALAGYGDDFLQYCVMQGGCLGGSQCFLFDHNGCVTILYDTK